MVGIDPVRREAILNRYADVSPDGVFSTKIQNPRARFIAALNQLLSGRLCLSSKGVGRCKQALYIGVRYSLSRLSTGESGESDTPIMLNGLQIRAFLPLIARTYAISVVGMTSVFVDTDLAYIGLTQPEICGVSDRLLPVIAHDRAGFGGGLFSIGVMVIIIVLHAPVTRSFLQVMMLSGGAGFFAAIGVHFAVGQAGRLKIGNNVVTSPNSFACGQPSSRLKRFSNPSGSAGRSATPIARITLRSVSVRWPMIHAAQLAFSLGRWRYSRGCRSMVNRWTISSESVRLWAMASLGVCMGDVSKIVMAFRRL